MKRCQSKIEIKVAAKRNSRYKLLVSKLKNKIRLIYAIVLSRKKIRKGSLTLFLSIVTYPT